MLRTAFSFTRNNLKSWPVVKTDNMDDYSQVEQHASTSPYVWLINSRYEINDTFNYNWHPEEHEKLNVHLFPRCSKQSKRPLSWNAAKLVPTSIYRSDEEIKQPLIASYGTSGFLIVYAFNDPIAVKKLPNFDSTECPYQLVKRHYSFQQFIMDINVDYVGDWVWIIDVDVEHDKDFKFDFIPQKQNEVYFWKVKHDSTKLSYADRSVMLVPTSYIIDLQKGNPIKHKFKLMNETAGILHDTTNPLKTWSRAYAKTMQLINNDLGHVNKQIKNRILEKMLAHDNDYIREACNLATADSDETTTIEEQKEHFLNSQNFEWLEEKFVSIQKEKLTKITANSSAKAQERRAKAYGN